MSNLHQAPSWRVIGVLLVLAIAMPFVSAAFGQEFYVGVLTRIMIYAMVATSLNLLIGFGGMICFGHAAFFGLGAYTVGILAQSGVESALIAWPAAVLVAAIAAWLIGLVSLRTRGVYFIMITLAFAQMIYLLFISLADYGGDDGLAMTQRSALPLGIDPAKDTVFYFVVLVLLGAVIALVQRLVNARFGRVLQAIRENEQRTEAVGYPVFRYKLTAFVLAGAMAGLGGALIANQNGMVSPNLMFWTQSGSLMIMVIVGGVGHIYGGLFGAFVLLALEELLSSYTIYWPLPLGIALLAVVLYAPRGVAGLIDRRRHA